VGTEYKYRAFISYSHKDEKWAAWLHKALETFRVPKYIVGKTTTMGTVPQRMGKVFRDREELSSSHSLGTELTQALTDSACQIVICSPNAANSHWTNEEILTYKRLGRENRIFCLIVDGEPGTDQECFPPAVRFQMGADGVLSDRPAEPIAADGRPQGDGKQNAKLKLISGMLGVGFDALKQREQQRRHRRMYIITAAAVAGMVVASGLATMAVLARIEADVQRKQAEIEAETARQTTNFMVGLFSVSDPSEALGNTITAREILDQGARRIEFELEDQPAIQSTLMDTMGTVYQSLGLYDVAWTLLQRGLNTRQEYYGGDHPDVARSKANLGQLLGLQADFEAAAQLYLDAIAIQRAASDVPTPELAVSLSGLADIRSLQGDYEGAEELLRDAVEIQRQTLGDENLTVAKTLNHLGMSLWDQGKYDAAEPLLRESLAMGRKVVPGGVHPDLNESLNNLAVFLLDTGEYEETEKLFRESLDINLRLLGEDHPDIAISLNNLAFVLHDTRNYEAAREYYQRALDIRLAVFGEQHQQTAQSLNNLAFLYHDQGETERSLEFSQRALAAFRSVYPDDHLEVARGLQNLAGWLVEEGDYEIAETMLNEALSMNQRILPSDHPDIAITQSGMAVLMLETDRAEVALKMAEAANESLATAYDADHWRVGWARALEGASLTALGRFADAEPLLIQAHKTLSSGSGARESQVASCLQYLVDLYTALDRPEDAARYGELLRLGKGS